MGTKTRRQRESGLRDARQGLTILALLAAIWAWRGTSSLFVGFLVFMLAVFAIEIVLILPQIVRRHRLQACDYDKVYSMNGEEFEEYLQALFVAKGYRATLTPNGSDFGADLINEKNGQKTAVQAKHWVKRDVGVTAVQEVHAARAYYHANKAMVVSVGTFTKQAIDLARESQVELWDGPRLQKEMLTLRSQNASTGGLAFARSPELPAAEVPLRAEVQAPAPSCPRCGSAMVQRHSKYGQFWGCSGFPGCRGTRQA